MVKRRGTPGLGMCCPLSTVKTCEGVAVTLPIPTTRNGQLRALWSGNQSGDDMMKTG